MRLRVLVSLVACTPLLVSSAPELPPVLDLQKVTLDFVAEIPRKGSEGMTMPSETDARRFIAGVRAITSGQPVLAQRLLRPLSYSLSRITDSLTGRDSWVLAESRNEDGSWPHGWGLYVFAAEAANPLVIEVPHPLYDVNTPQAGVEAFRRGDAQALLVAGTHRYANSDGSSDVAHQAGTMFALVHQTIVTGRQSVAQFHGFDGSGSEGLGDIVVSAGEPTPDIAVDPVTDSLRVAGFDVCQYDGEHCASLGGTQNVQGEWCRLMKARFLHVELSREVRDDPVLRSLAARTVAEALTGDSALSAAAAPRPPAQTQSWRRWRAGR